MASETELVQERYARREDPGVYSISPSEYLARQERERRLIGLIWSCGLRPMREKTILDVGCGVGNDLLTLIRLGYQPEHLTGCDLLKERAEIARHRLPEACSILTGDALELPLEPVDIVMQSTVFTSLLDYGFQERLADRMWELAGNGILWYDFAYDNPRNRDVCGVSLRRIRELFPRGKITAKRVTLAPPISRRVAKAHLYGLFNAIPLLRSHLLCWIAKSVSARTID
jgi:SAM-dependent methyltransferase